MTRANPGDTVRERALELGFDSVGVTDLSPVPHAAALGAWLARGMAGTMAYMGRQKRRRLDPALILEGADRAVVVTRTYFTPDSSAERPPKTGVVAKYARGRDYHVALKEDLTALAATIVALGDENTLAQPFVDAGPVPERELAQRAGLGWIGKNTMLLHPDRGSFFFIGSVLTNLDLEVDPPFNLDRCGTCRRCIDACPTNALVEERVLDARACISYLTIEARSDAPVELAPLMGDLVFGCDICQDVCPWNVKFARPAADPVLERDPGLERLELGQFAAMNQAEFDERYGWTPLERPGLSGMRRNALIALRNCDGDHQ